MLGAMAAAPGLAAASLAAPNARAQEGEKLAAAANPDYTLEARGYENIAPADKAKKYNNFYELGTDKSDPHRNNHLYQPRPWRVEVSGAVARPQTFDIDDLAKLAANGGARLPPAVRGGMVNGHPLDWLFHVGAHSQSGAACRVQVCAISHLQSRRVVSRRRQRLAAVAVFRGAADGRGDASRSPPWFSACMASACRCKTARRCACSFPGNTDSNPARRRPKSSFRRRCRRPLGIFCSRPNTAFSPMSTPKSATPAGVRRAKRFFPTVCFRRAAKPTCLTDSPTRSRRFTPAWI